MSLFYSKFEDQKNLYLIKWQHRIQYFVQLSMSLSLYPTKEGRSGRTAAVRVQDH
jgi:hypothetical protein